MSDGLAVAIPGSCHPLLCLLLMCMHSLYTSVDIEFTGKYCCGTATLKQAELEVFSDLIASEGFCYVENQFGKIRMVSQP